MEKIALVKCIRKYYDTEMDRLVFVREEISVSLERSKVLIKENVCELIEIR